jgi:hypothetical protein
MAEPRDANALTKLEAFNFAAQLPDMVYNLMTGNDWIMPRNITLYDVQICSVGAAGGNLDQHFFRSWNGHCVMNVAQRLS